MDSNDRKKDVLKVLVETFVHTNQPVGSIQVVEQLPYGVSSATIRNDMVEMTELDLLEQPHTSAGRIPTDLGYRHYVKILTEERKEISKRQRDVLTSHLKNLKDFEDRYRTAVKLLAELTGGVGVLMDDAKKVYISGLGQVARLPEFSDKSFGVKLIEALEQPEEFIEELSDQISSDNVSVLIGDDMQQIENATIVISNFGPNKKKIISIIGPTRMQYKKALPLVDYMRQILEEEF